MTPPKVAVYLIYLFLGKIGQMADLKLSVYQERDFISANVGDSVTLRCFYESYPSAMFYWYKQSLGQEPRIISSMFNYNKEVTFHHGFKDNPRFTLETQKSENHLKISGLQISDSATYYCVSRYSFTFEFADGTELIIKGAGLNLRYLVHQPASETIQPGDSMTLNCTIHTRSCDGEHSVYWFRSSGESHPGIIYSHGVRNDQCERKPKAQTQTCVYNFPINVADAESNYCAVVSCGEMLFGNVIQSETENKMDPFLLVYFLSGALAFTIVLVVLLALSVYKIKKKNICQHTDCQGLSAPSTNAEHGRGADNLHYAAIMENRSNRGRQRENIRTECVYSRIKQSS